MTLLEPSKRNIVESESDSDNEVQEIEMEREKRIKKKEHSAGTIKLMKKIARRAAKDAPTVSSKMQL